ncbi:MAG TPA: hypothetical protein VKU36_04205 [Candidatus Babeliales bacterium]|nr:hypothetical protein [Candidatus Babeliales bacterium]
MKKSIIAVALLLVATQANAGLFDDAMSFLKKNAASLFEKGKKLLSDNSDKIWDLVKEQGAPLLGKGIDYTKEQLGTGQVGTLVGKGLDLAKEQLVGKTPTKETEKTPTTGTKTAATKPAGTKTVEEAAVLVKNEAQKEADKEEKELLTQAQTLVKDKNLTLAEQKMILQEAQALANQNRAALERQAIESIATKREALKQSVYAKYGKGTPIVR